MTLVPQILDPVPTQTLDTSGWVPVEPDDLVQAEVAARETRWWYLEPGEPGYDRPLHEYLGFTEAQWREYAISERRVR